ncbi:MAG: hypothetical protein J2P34_07005, partial [Actinobacteria bacterium]|nr:hypothetical protein [Actinomycetota bacterium]
MPAEPMAAAVRPPRRARYLIPLDLPRRAEIIAVLSMAALAAQLLAAPLTLALAVVFHAVSRASRWRPQWLLLPAAAGVALVLAIGPGAALAGFTAATRALAALATAPDQVARLGGMAGPLHYLPGQLPLALVAAAAEAAVAWWVRWLHTAEWDFPEPRPGLVIAARRWLTGARVRSGQVLTRDGACLGLDEHTGRPVAVSWREAAGGVLVTGTSWATVATTGCQFLHAAIRRRKPVIAIDLAGDPGLAAALAAACAAAEAPLQVLGGSGTGQARTGDDAQQGSAGNAAAPARPGYYEPLRSGSPARKASLVAGMIDWTGRPQAVQRDCTAALADIFALAAAAPAGPGTAVIDDVIRLLDPAGLRARLERVPPYHPRRGSLAQRTAMSAARLESDPDSAALVARQLAALRSSPLGCWLAPGPPAGQAGPRISVEGVIRSRGVALFPLSRTVHGHAAEMMAALVALDTAGVVTDLRRAGIAADPVFWAGPCEGVDPAALAALLAAGSQAGLACVLATTAAGAAGRLAGEVGVLAAHRLGDLGL